MEREFLEAEFSIQEVILLLQGLQSNKASGPDGVRNEHLKSALVLAPCWTALLNKCMIAGSIPRNWRDAILLVIPKGKGDPTQPTSYRGIAKKSVCYKLLSSLLTRRLNLFLELTGVLPEEQHGFRAGRSTGSACKLLLRDIQDSQAKRKCPLYAVFVDFRAAFDTAARDLILRNLAEVGVPQRILKLLTAILQRNRIIVDDGVAEHPSFDQTTGVMQGDNLSPLLFSVLIKDLARLIKGPRDLVKVLMYADDLVVYGTSRFQVQQALARLNAAVGNLGLTVNVAKTKAMKFRQGGYLAANDTLRLAGIPLEFVNQFPYLGVVLPTNGKSFGAHIEERCRKAQMASFTIKDPHKLSLATALKLFQIKIAPVASYGIEVIWECLSAEHLSSLDRTKMAFLKRALRIHSSSRNRLVLLLTDGSLFTEDLKRQFKLPVTAAFEAHIQSWESKLSEVDPQFFMTGAMKNNIWKGPGRTNRHVVTRYAVNGFHLKLCTSEGHHQASEECVCSRCGQQCLTYHASICPHVESLNILAASN